MLGWAPDQVVWLLPRYILILLSFPLPYYLTHSEISYHQPIDPELVVLASFAIFSRKKATIEVAEMVEQR